MAKSLESRSTKDNKERRGNVLNMPCLAPLSNPLSAPSFRSMDPEQLHEFFEGVREKITIFEEMYPQYKAWEIARHEIWVIQKIIEWEGRKKLKVA